MELPNKIVKVREDLKKRTNPGAILKYLPNLLKALESDKKTFLYMSKLKKESSKQEAHNGLNWHADLESDPVTLYRFLDFHAQYGVFKPLVLSQENWPQSAEEAITFAQQVHVSMYWSSFAEADPDQIFPKEPPYSCEKLIRLIDIFLSFVEIGLNDNSKKSQECLLTPDKKLHWRTEEYNADLTVLKPLFVQARREYKTPDKVPRGKLIPIVKETVKRKGLILNNPTESLYIKASQLGDYREKHPRGPASS
jgi:hypothetical protein